MKWTDVIGGLVCGTFFLAMAGVIAFRLLFVG